jgi:hypothetical protein
MSAASFCPLLIYSIFLIRPYELEFQSLHRQLCSGQQDASTSYGETKFQEHTRVHNLPFKTPLTLL